MDASLLGALFLSGLLGSLGHCVGMCGPLVAMAVMQMKAGGSASAAGYGLYHAARISIYVLLGLVAGAAGSLFGLGSGLNQVGAVVSLALGAVTILLALSYLGLLPAELVGGPGAWLGQAMARAMRLGGLGGAAALGAMNGLLPCGLVYGALFVAASLGSAPAAGAGMLAFGLATVPAMLLVAAGVGAMSGRVRQRLATVAGIVLLAAGSQLALRGLSALGAVPHLEFGGIMLW